MIPLHAVILYLIYNHIFFELRSWSDSRSLREHQTKGQTKTWNRPLFFHTTAIMSSPSSSPRLSIHSPPFTPIRSSTRKGTTLASPFDATPAMLLTPGATPSAGKATNRFGVLASPGATRNTTRVPLKAKSQNIVDPSVGADANWRVNRKRDQPKTPVRANGNGS